MTLCKEGSWPTTHASQLTSTQMTNIENKTTHVPTNEFLVYVRKTLKMAESKVSTSCLPSNRYREGKWVRSLQVQYVNFCVDRQNKLPLEFGQYHGSCAEARKHALSSVGWWSIEDWILLCQWWWRRLWIVLGCLRCWSIFLTPSHWEVFSSESVAGCVLP